MRVVLAFFPTKNLGGCGDGGALTTNNKAIADKIKLLREHGLVREASNKVTYRHEVTGLNSRLDSMQATILSIKLKYLALWNQQRQQAATNYSQLLDSVPHIKLPSTLTDGNSVWNQYTIRIPNQSSDKANTTRDRIRQDLQEKGVMAMVYYPFPLHLQPVYQHLDYQVDSLPKVEQTAQEVLSLPMFPGITKEEQQQVVYALKDALEANLK